MLWEPFTERARRSIVLAQEEAQRLGNNYIGTEHILLGLIYERENVASEVLGTFGVDLANARQEVEAIVGRGGVIVQQLQQEMVFTPSGKRAIELAFTEAQRLQHSYIGSEHLLLGVLTEGQGVGARTLQNLHVDLADLRTAVLARVAGRAKAHKSDLSLKALSSELFAKQNISKERFASIVDQHREMHAPQETTCDLCWLIGTLDRLP